MKNQRGFILIELIAVIVLTGIIATFTTLFLTTGFTGYQRSKNTSEGALNAQMALDRITLELRNLDYFTTPPVPNTSISYRSTKLIGARTINFSGNNILLNGNMLLEDVSAFSLSANCMDLDNGGPNETAHIDIGFNVSGIGKTFKTKIFPRNMVNCPP